MALSNYTVEQTPKTPQIDLNQLSGELILSGRSIPENAAKIYEPVLNWVKEYILNARPITNLRLNLEYFNTASMMWLSRIMAVLKKINDPEFILYVHLYMPLEEYDDMNDIEDIRDALIPVRDILQDATPCVGIKLYGTNNSEVIKDALVFI
ncbi:MAG TPA: SiaC family regulatory phosphoprotein [Candidatus Cloacimonadota bacterium]|nr:SiaC family regulatory phosphoprotein [Candidatus Cloacimonadota bacterium]